MIGALAGGDSAGRRAAAVMLPGRFKLGVGSGEASPRLWPNDRHIESIQEYAEAGVDELYIQQIGGRHDEFFEAYAREVLPRFS